MLILKKTGHSEPHCNKPTRMKWRRFKLFLPFFAFVINNSMRFATFAKFKLIPTLIIAGLVLAAPRLGAQVTQVFRADKLAAMDAAIEAAIASNRCPGGVLWLERNGVVYEKAYGERSLVPDREPMTEDTIFDMASLTKVEATTPSVMLLIERGQVKLDAPVCTYIPEFTGGGKEKVTVRELLTHTSGLPPDIETSSDWHGWKTAIKMACEVTLDAPARDRL